MGETNDTKTLAQTAYEAYAEHTGGKTYDGREMPRWADLPERIRGAWEAAAARVLMCEDAKYRQRHVALMEQMLATVGTQGTAGMWTVTQPVQEPEPEPEPDPATRPPKLYRDRLVHALAVQMAPEFSAATTMGVETLCDNSEAIADELMRRMAAREGGAK